MGQITKEVISNEETKRTISFVFRYGNMENGHTGPWEKIWFKKGEVARNATCSNWNLTQQESYLPRELIFNQDDFDFLIGKGR